MVSSPLGFAYGQSQPSDPQATPEARALLDGLYRASQQNRIVFGQHYATLEGVHVSGNDRIEWKAWTGDVSRCDLKTAFGEYPGLYGFNAERDEIRRFGEGAIRKAVREAYDRGGIATFYWTMDNPETGSEHNEMPWTYTPRKIVFGGPWNGVDVRAEYYRKIDEFADFAKTMTKWENGLEFKIPFILRPLHEGNHSGFWWGLDWTTAEQYKEVYRMMVDRLRGHHGLHNILFAYAPGASIVDLGDYIDRYPGDDYVDICGVDFYLGTHANSGHTNDSDDMADALNHTLWFAHHHNKVGALTETGPEGGLGDVGLDFRYHKIYNGHIMNALTQINAPRGPAYMMVWSNGGAWYYHTPYASTDQGSTAYNNTKTFFDRTRIMLENETRGFGFK